MRFTQVDRFFFNYELVSVSSAELCGRVQKKIDIFFLSEKEKLRTSFRNSVESKLSLILNGLIANFTYRVVDGNTFEHTSISN